MQKLPVIITPKPKYYSILTVVTWLLLFIPGVLILFDLGAPRPKGEFPNTHIYLGLAFVILSFACFYVMRVLPAKLAQTIISRSGIRHSSIGQRIYASWDEVESAKIMGFTTSFVVVTLRSDCSELYGRTFFGINALGSGLSPEDIKGLVERMANAALQTRADQPAKSKG